MKTTVEKQEIPEEDIALFETMRDKYVSENEARFFRIMQHKEEYELAPQNDLLLDDKDNEDAISIVRVYNFEYEVLRIRNINGKFVRAQSYSDSLADALSANLKEAGLLDDDSTLLEWLRQNDYKGIQYGGNCNEEYVVDYSDF